MVKSKATKMVELMKSELLSLPDKYFSELVIECNSSTNYIGYAFVHIQERHTKGRPARLENVGTLHADRRGVPTTYAATSYRLGSKVGDDEFKSLQDAADALIKAHEATNSMRKRIFR